jgi:hypothetical protein
VIVSGRPVYDVQGGLLRLPKEAQTSVRWRGQELEHKTLLEAEKIRDLFRGRHSIRQPFYAQGYLCLDRDPFRSGQQAQSAIDLAQRLQHENLPSLNSALRDLEKATGFKAAEGLRGG